MRVFTKRSSPLVNNLMMPRRTTKYLSITAGATTTYPPVITT
jgi:hypothetical protein